MNGQQCGLENSAVLLSGILSESEVLRIIDEFPYPLHIYTPDGTSVFINRAFIKEFHIPDPLKIQGHYNIFKDKMMEIGGINEAIIKAFAGESIFLKNIKAPLEYINKMHNIVDSDIEAMYQDITAFSVKNEDLSLKYVVVMMITKYMYSGKNEISKAKEYILTHCHEKFALRDVAKNSGFSSSYFSRLFKKHCEVTPHEFYMDCKIKKIREQLINSEVSVSEAFSRCGADYNGSMAKAFRKITGMSPSEYRKKYSK